MGTYEDCYEMESEVVKSFIKTLNNFDVEVKKNPSIEEQFIMDKCIEMSLKLSAFAQNALHSN